MPQRQCRLSQNKPRPRFRNATAATTDEPSPRTYIGFVICTKHHFASMNKSLLNPCRTLSCTQRICLTRQHPVSDMTLRYECFPARNAKYQSFPLTNTTRQSTRPHCKIATIANSNARIYTLQTNETRCFYLGVVDVTQLNLSTLGARDPSKSRHPHCIEGK